MVHSLKKWILIHKSIIKLELSINFLKDCLNCDITPPHLHRFVRQERSLKHIRSVAKFKNIVNKFINSTIRNEISDAYRQIRFLRVQIRNLVNDITQIIPISIYNNFLRKQDRYLRFIFVSEECRLKNKLAWLVRKEGL